MHMQLFVWINREDNKWYIDREVWCGGSWGSYYIRVSGPFDTKELALEYLKERYFMKGSK